MGPLHEIDGLDLHLIRGPGERMSAGLRVLVLGGAGFVGRRVVAQLHAAGCRVTVASRRLRPAVNGVDSMVLNAHDAVSLGLALQSQDAVVNCVTGSGPDILGTTRSLVQALRAGGPCQRLVHMSSMAAFGELQGDLADDTPLGVGGGWYAEAKRDAEALLCSAASTSLRIILLRPGCVHGPNSQLWVTRFGDALRQGRLGDLGAAGDGWSNLVHVNDVARATLLALSAQWSGPTAWPVNLSAPDSPRWNDYLVALGCAIKATPVKRIHPRQLQLDAYALALPLRAWERLAPRLGLSAGRWVPPALPPSLLTLFAHDRRLRSDRATVELGLPWTSFAAGVQDSARWYLGHVGTS